jgi:exopolysaccharide biosynthesis polyprenyl glycosylphosphotransferase
VEQPTTLELSDFSGRAEVTTPATAWWRGLDITPGVAWLFDVGAIAVTVAVSLAIVAANSQVLADTVLARPEALGAGIVTAVVAAYASGLGEAAVLRSMRDTCLRAVLVAGAAVMAMLLTSWVASHTVVQAHELALVGTTLTAALGGWRVAAMRRPGRERREPVVVVGTGPESRAFTRLVESIDHARHRVVGYVTADDRLYSGMVGDRPVLGRFCDLDQICSTRNVRTVVLGDEVAKTSASVGVLSLLKARGIRCRTAGTMAMSLTHRVPVELVDARWLVAGFENIERGGRRHAKRAFDVVLASIGLLGFALILPLVWIAVKLDSPGPLFFSQPRVGQAGQPFRLFKIRTMRVAPPSEQWVSASAHRITRLGAFLRKVRIDELPQFWNVLRGDMSIVGPRPEQPGITRTLEESIPLFGLRHLVKPGITGWAQINHGYASSVDDSATKLAYDLYYVCHYSIVMDLDIMLRTAFVMALGHGAR